MSISHCLPHWRWTHWYINVYVCTLAAAANYWQPHQQTPNLISKLQRLVICDYYWKQHRESGSQPCCVDSLWISTSDTKNNDTNSNNNKSDLHSKFSNIHSLPNADGSFICIWFCNTSWSKIGSAFTVTNLMLIIFYNHMNCNYLSETVFAFIIPQTGWNLVIN